MEEEAAQVKIGCSLALNNATHYFNQLPNRTSLDTSPHHLALYQPR